MKSTLAPLLLALCSAALAEEKGTTAPPPKGFPSVWTPTTGLHTKLVEPNASISQAICGYGHATVECTVTVTVDANCKVTLDKLIINFEKGSAASVTWKLNAPANYEFRDDSIVIDETNTKLAVSKPKLESTAKLISWQRAESISGTLYETPKIVYFYTINVYKKGVKDPCGVVDPLIISHG
jgi:hypothetical protein